MRLSRKISLGVMLGAVMIFILGVVATAAPMQAVVMTAKGKVEYKAPGAADWKPAAAGMKLSEGAAVRCAAGAEAVIRWASGNVIKVFALSSVTLTKMDKDANGVENSTVGMDGGKILAKVSKMAPGSKFELATPSAVAGVRGSDLFGDMSKGSAVSFACLSGVGYIVAAGQEVNLPAGTMSSVEPGQPPTPPEPIPPEIKNELQSSMKEVSDATVAPAPTITEPGAEEATDAGQEAAADSVSDTVTDATTTMNVQEQLNDVSTACCQHDTEMNWGPQD